MKDDGNIDVDVEFSPPWKAFKSSALSNTKIGGQRAAPPDLNRYASVAAPYGPADPVASTYFQVVISKAKAPIVCGDAGPVKGKAIYANQNLPKATRIWTESPLVAMQHELNQRRLPCCQFCYLPLLGDAYRQWHDIVTRYNQNLKETSPGDKSTKPVKANALEEALKLLHISSQSCGMAGPGAKCACGEIYCSKLCQMRALHEYHAILCPRSNMCSAMGEFLNHTRHTNDIFVLAAKVIARVLSRFLVWRDVIKAREPIDMFYKKPWWEVVMIEHGEEESSHSNPLNSDTTTVGHQINFDSRTSTWTDDRSPTDVKDVDETNCSNATTQQIKDSHWSVVSTQAQCLQEVLTITHQLLVDALECNLVRLEREGQLRSVTVEEIWRSCSSVLSFEFFTAQIGLFEMNNISMEVDHPFRALIDILDPDVQNDVVASDSDHSEGHILSPRLQPQLTAENHCVLSSVRRVLEWEKERLQQIGTESNKLNQLVASLGFPSVEGTALFPIICTMNHSCDPNCTVMYTQNGNGHVVAIRDIQQGEELCICYIDIDMDVQMREANLREYKFKCFCSRCVQERQQLEQQPPHQIM
ncbi:hypothetical protein CCR75_008466 [Bremia lactucae]|uniref:SET domain-containing protein n=1 Tax=Bremia lactucae TaxID=4779 RepID=A0A976FGN0_BRELC|nr:hypothetical protein CCR75_008466 [Bremia lactucae]